MDGIDSVPNLFIAFFYYGGSDRVDSVEDVCVVSLDDHDPVVSDRYRVHVVIFIQVDSVPAADALGI